MGTDQGLHRVVQTAVTQALDGAADILTFAPATPIDVVEFGFIADVAIVGTGTVHLDHRVLVDSDTGRVDGTAAAGRILTVPACAAGIHTFKRVGEVPSTTVATDQSPMEVNPGEEVVVQAIGDATSGDGTFYIRYRERAQSGVRIENSVEST